MVGAFQSSLGGNQIGDAMMKEVQAALKYKPTPEVLAEYSQERERLLWQSFMWRPTFLCHHQLCRPQAQLVAYTVLCVEARLYFTMGQDDANVLGVKRSKMVPPPRFVHVARGFGGVNPDDVDIPSSDEDDDWENGGLSYIPTELWYIILSFLRTSELGI